MNSNEVEGYLEHHKYRDNNLYDYLDKMKDQKDEDSSYEKFVVVTKEYTLDELYGVSLEDYCLLHNITYDELISKVKIDINILRKNYELYSLKNKDDVTYDEVSLAIEISKQINKKNIHLKKLADYKANQIKVGEDNVRNV